MSIFVFDLETNCVNVHEARPVQIGLIGEVGGEMRTLINTLCNPLAPIEKEAQEVHGVTEEKVRSAPDYLITLWQVKLISIALKPKYVVTYNGSMFDLPIANRLMKGIFGSAKGIDVLDLAYRYFPEVKGPTGKKTLSDLHQVFLNRPLDLAHDAVADVYGVWDLFQVMRKKIGKTIEQLADELAVPTPYSIIPIGKYTGTLIDNMPKSWAQYMSQSADLRPDLRATIDYILNS